MADYREISQQYAQGAIKATILVNGGAAVALLSQAADLVKADAAGNVRWAMIAWAFGVLIGAAAWVPAFVSTRYVDKSEREPEQKDQHLQASNRCMFTGVAAVAISLGCFIIGSIVLARSF